MTNFDLLNICRDCIVIVEVLYVLYHSVQQQNLHLHMMFGEALDFYNNCLNTCAFIYRVFHLFRQAKFDNGGSILTLSQFFDTAPAASKNEARSKSGQN